MKKNFMYVDKIVPLLMMGGFMVHAINLATYIQFGATALNRILLPAADIFLAFMMVYCAVGLIVFHKQFFAAFRLISVWRKVSYWIITFYITASIPGHFMFLVLGNTSYFDFFPWWFSPIIMVVYVLFISYFLSLKRVEKTS
jgi:hypothetical protein